MQRDTNDKKNDLEAYIYSLRGKLSDVLSSYVPEAAKEAISSRLTAMEVPPPPPPTPPTPHRSSSRLIGRPVCT